MKFPARLTYLIKLSQCRAIVNPTYEQLKSICPHLSPSQVMILHESPGYWRIALPPIKVRGRVQIAEYNRTPRGHLLALHPLDTHLPVPYWEEAIAYAEHHWHKELVEDTWVDAVSVYVMDVLGSRAPRLQYELYLGLNCAWHSIVESRDGIIDRFDNAIAIVTTSFLEGKEIIGRHNEYLTYNCTRCGGGLSRHACLGCSLAYKGTFPIVATWNLPLPPKLTTILQEEFQHRFIAGYPAKLYT